MSLQHFELLKATIGRGLPSIALQGPSEQLSSGSIDAQPVHGSPVVWRLGYRHAQREVAKKFPFVNFGPPLSLFLSYQTVG